MTIDVTASKWNIDSTGTWLCLQVRTPQEATSICDEMDPEKTYTAKIEQKRKKRSLNANNYLWTLCDKLAEVNGTVKEEVYRLAIKEVGVFKDFCGLSVDDAKTLQTAWSRLGTGWVSEQVDYMPDGDNVVLRCYYGSSVYNTKQMSRLIDYIVQDCKACDIETLTPEELSVLKDEWNEQKK